MEPTQKPVNQSFLSSSKKTIGMVVILVLAIAVPVTLGLIKQNQDNRQEASSNANVTDTKAEYLNETGKVKVTISGSADIYHIYIHGSDAPKSGDANNATYNPSNIEKNQFYKLASVPWENNKVYEFTRPSEFGEYYVAVNAEILNRDYDSSITDKNDPKSIKYIGCSWEKFGYARYADNSIKRVSLFDNSCVNNSVKKFSVSRIVNVGDSCKLDVVVPESGDQNRAQVRISNASVASGYDRVKWSAQLLNSQGSVSGNPIVQHTNFSPPDEQYTFSNLQNGSYRFLAEIYGNNNNTIPAVQCEDKTLAIGGNAGGGSSSTSLSVGNFTPVVNGNNITFTITGSATKFWVYIMRAPTMPDRNNSIQYLPVQEYNASIPLDNTFYKAQVTSGTSVSFPKPTTAGNYWVVVNAHSDTYEGVPWAAADRVCAWDGKMYKYTSTGVALSGDPDCTNIGARFVGITAGGGSSDPGGSGGQGPGDGPGRNPGTTSTVTPTPITFNPPKVIYAYTRIDTNGDGIGDKAQSNVPITVKQGTTIVQTVNTNAQGLAPFMIRQSGTYTVTAATTIHTYNPPNPVTVTFTANTVSPQNIYFVIKSPVTPTASATATMTRTPTTTRIPTTTVTTSPPAGGSMTLAVKATLPGIGSRTGDNTTPRNPNRPAQIQIFNTNNEQVKSATAALTYQAGIYSGSTNISGLSAGTYYIKISMNNTLFTQLPGVVNLVTGNNNLASIQLVPGDINQDNNLNMVDHSIFVGCYGQKPCPQDQKTKSDFNDDGVIDGKDYNILIRSFAIRSGD